VLQKSCHRAISSLSGDAACAVVNIANTCLDSFLQVQQQMLQQTGQISSRNSSDSNSGSAKSVPYAVPLNNVAQSGDFVLRLRKELEQASRKHYAGQTRELAKLDVCWAELLQMSSTYKTSLQAALKQVASTLDPTLRELSELGGNASYVLTEKDYSARQLDDEGSWPWRMMREIETLVVPFRSSLLPVCWDALSKALASGLATRLERFVMSKKYNALGGLQMSRDISTVAHAITQLCPAGRSDIARLNQMCVTICVEHCSDIEELASASSWRLTPGETRRLLARRIEFTAEQVAGVKL